MVYQPTPLRRLGNPSQQVLACAEFFQCFFQFMLFCHNRNGVAFENVADGLLLRQDEPAFWSGLIYRCDKNNKIARLNQVPNNSKLILVFGQTRSDGLFKDCMPLPFAAETGRTGTLYFSLRLQCLPQLTGLRLVCLEQ